MYSPYFPKQISGTDVWISTYVLGMVKKSWRVTISYPINGQYHSFVLSFLSSQRKIGPWVNREQYLVTNFSVSNSFYGLEKIQSQLIKPFVFFFQSALSLSLCTPNPEDTVHKSYKSCTIPSILVWSCSSSSL